MRILQFIYTLGSGGGEKFVVDLSNELSRLGHEVHLITVSEEEERYKFNKQFLSGDVTYHCLHCSVKLNLSTIPKLERLIEEINPDVVNSHLNILYLYRLSLRRKDIKFIYTLHSVANVCIGKGIFRWLAKYFFKKGYITPITISAECANSYVKYLGLPKPAMIVNGRDKTPVSERFDAVKAEIMSYKGCNESKVFIHVARCNPLKNQGLLIESFNKLASSGFDFTLLVIGNYFDTEAGEDLKAMACDRIHFLGEKNNVSDYLACSDYFCLSSKFEGLPISLLEALAYGVTPICTAVGGIPDVIIDGKSGYLSTDLTVDSFVSTIKRALARPISSADLIAIYENKYSMKTCAAKYLELYRND